MRVGTYRSSSPRILAPKHNGLPRCVNHIEPTPLIRFGSSESCRRAAALEPGTSGAVDGDLKIPRISASEWQAEGEVRRPERFRAARV